MNKNKFMISAILVMFFMIMLWAAPSISTVTRSADQVGKYAKIELVVGLTGTYTNPYDPDQIDLSATFTAPSGTKWKINGFYGVDASNNLSWKIRFAPDEVGAWSYTVQAIDPTGTATGPGGTFTCTASTNHGWLRVASNGRYLKLDDGSSFYGVGPCYPYNVTFPGFHQLQSYGCNTYVYWNGTNDGYGLIESVASGIGKYDQPKCRRVDSLLDSSESLGLKMFFVLWPHDYLGQSLVPGWTEQWSDHTPYASVVDKAADFYGDSTAWKYEQKEYRYIIARYSYHQSLGGWQTIDEINGTDGWVSNQAAANAWTTKMADYFHTNDLFKHPTNASEANDYWAHGDSVNDMTNTENYNSTTAASWASLVQKLWNGNKKPAIVGESTNSNAHTNLWSTLATGIAITPLMWQFNANTSSWSPTISANWPPVVAFVKGINFAGLTNLKQATATVTGATAYGISSDQITFGWITGTFSGKSLSATGLANGGSTLEWWNTTAGTILSTNAVTVTGGALTAAIPVSTAADIAFKIISPLGVGVIQQSSPLTINSKQVITYDHGALRLLKPLSGDAVVTITTVAGREIARYAVTGSNVSVIPVDRLESGVYFAKVTSGSGSIVQKVIAAGPK
jgi:hypothetical protein